MSAAHSSLWSGIEEWDAIGGFERVIELGRRCWRTRGVGDAWQYMLVAEGAAEIATDPEATLWDLAAVVDRGGGGRRALHEPHRCRWARIGQRPGDQRPAARRGTRRARRTALTRAVPGAYAHAPDSMLSGGPGTAAILVRRESHERPMRIIPHPEPGAAASHGCAARAQRPGPARDRADCSARTTSSPAGRLEVSVSKSTLTHHLRVLRDAGLTYTRSEGVQRLVSLRRDDVDTRFPGLLDCVLGSSEQRVEITAGV